MKLVTTHHLRSIYGSKYFGLSLRVAIGAIFLLGVMTRPRLRTELRSEPGPEQEVGETAPPTKLVAAIAAAIHAAQGRSLPRILKVKRLPAAPWRGFPEA